MRELAQTPLFLNLMMTAFKGEEIASEEQLFTNYVEAQFKRPLYPQKSSQVKQEKLPYSHGDTKKWLIYLAKQLESRLETVFLIENIQPTWLKSTKQKIVYRIIVGLIVRFILALNAVISVGLIILINPENNLLLQIELISTCLIYEVIILIILGIIVAVNGGLNIKIR
ncbi:MAG: hypothetical protein Tsb0014_34340 [Pleurocapsa sp.]